MKCAAARWRRLACGLAMATLAAVSAQAQIIALNRPQEGEFIADTASLLAPDDAGQIRTICARLQAEEHVPLIVVTINAMRDHGGADLRIETFATLLFDQWQIGSQDNNRGILFLVSTQDRAARIALGADWDRAADHTTQRIMDQDVIPYFKDAEFSQGIRSGVEALERMVRPQAAAPSPTPSAATQAPRSSSMPAQPNPLQRSHAGSAPPMRVVQSSPHSSCGAPGGIFAFLVFGVGAVFSFLRRLVGFGGGYGGGYGGWGGSYTSMHRHSQFGSPFGSSFGGGHHSSSFGSSSHGSSFGGGHTRGGGASGHW